MTPCHHAGFCTLGQVNATFDPSGKASASTARWYLLASQRPIDHTDGMVCASCSTTNPADAQFCSNCGVKIVEHTGTHREIAGLVANVDRSESPTGMATPPAPADAPPPSDAHQPTGVYQPPPGAPLPLAPMLGVAPVGAALPPATRKTSVIPIVAAVFVLIALIGMGAVLLMRWSDDTGGSTSPTVPPTDLGATPIAEGTSAGVAPAVIDPAPVTTAAPTNTEAPTEATTTSTTAATTTTPTGPVAPTTVPPNPAAIPPVPPEPGPIDAPGSPQVLANKQPSGLWFFEVQESFEIAQSFGDALALERWIDARLLDPDLANTSDADFIAGYGNTNRVSLILLDARQDGPSVQELLVVSVAVEFGGAQTSLYCLNWAANPEANTIDQRGGGRITTWDGVNAQPEAIRNDPAALAALTMCTWP
jgi:hypothetical protein